MKDFITQAKGLTKNPLGIIALFISLIYGFACLVLSFVSNNLIANERVLLIYFLIGFPILILITFIFLVVKHHNKLYAPSDYKDEKNFFKGFENQQGKLNLEQDVNIKSEKVASKKGEKAESMLSLLKWSSGKGLFALYAISLAKMSKKKFTLENLESHSSFLTKDYTHGFLVAASSSGAFSWSIKDDEPIFIGNIHPLISENIKNTVYKFAEKEKDDSDFLYQQLRDIEEAFK